MFVAYHYPPVVSGGVERTVKFERYLPEFGYVAHIVTTGAFGDSDARPGGAETAVARAWEPLALYRRIAHRCWRQPPPPSFVRAPASRLAPVRRFVTRHLLVPDGQTTWIPHALLLALRAVRRTGAVALYSTYPPASAHLLAWCLKGLTRLPWVADFRDSWTGDPLDPALLELPVRLAIERRLERRVVRAADLVVAATRLSANQLRGWRAHQPDRVRLIPNGYDPADIGPRPPPTPLAPGEPVRLVHTGAFALSHPQRTPGPLLAGLAQLAAADSAWRDRLRLVLAGPLTAAEAASVAPLQRSGMVEVLGPLPRAGALALQASAHALVLVDHARPWPASNVPGKLYEYLGLGRPILAVCGPGMVEELITELRAGRCVRPGDPRQIAAALVELHAELRAGRGPAPPSAAALAPYTRRAQAAALAQCFDAAIAGSLCP